PGQWHSAVHAGHPATGERRRAAGCLALAGAGFASYSVYIFRLTSNSFEWAATLQRWGYHPGDAAWNAPLRLMGRLLTHPYLYLTTDRMAPYDTLYGVSAVAFALAVPLVWRRLGAGYGLYM